VRCVIGGEIGGEVKHYGFLQQGNSLNSWLTGWSNCIWHEWLLSGTIWDVACYYTDQSEQIQKMCPL